MAFLDVQAVTFTYPKQSAPALSGVSFSVEQGEFLALCGATGSGKSTLLRLMKRELAPRGTRTGCILLEGADIENLPDREAARRIGYVMQRPEQQLVTDKVWHELAFGLENLGVPQPEMARRVAEMAAYFNMEDWFERPVAELSGGQKQLLNLAAVMVMQPDLLLLDEPTAQLDPIAAQEFIAAVHRINRELGLTVVIIEHRLEEIIPLCDRLLVLEGGRMTYDAAPREAVSAMAGNAALRPMLPAAARLAHRLGWAGPLPLSIREGRAWLGKQAKPADALPEAVPQQNMEEALRFCGVSFRYQRHTPDVLRGLDFAVHTGEIVCLLGGNGSGKSTALSVAAALRRPWEGEVRVFGKPLKQWKNQTLYQRCLTLLPQDVQTLFLHDTVQEELADVPPEAHAANFSALLAHHPYDLSGGEQQMLALSKVLATQPRLLLLDEPTKGIDASAKQRMMAVLRRLRAEGVAMLIVTHDVEFAADLADRCLFMFRGQVVSDAPPRAFFAGNSFYTTAVSRITRDVLPDAVTVEDAANRLRRCGG